MPSCSQTGPKTSREPLMGAPRSCSAVFGSALFSVRLPTESVEVGHRVGVFPVRSIRQAEQYVHFRGLVRQCSFRARSEQSEDETIQPIGGELAKLKGLQVWIPYFRAICSRCWCS